MGFEPTRCGRYWMFGELATGGMASVHFGRLIGARGFSLTVVIKRLLPAIANDPAFVAMFANEARLASRIRHPNVVPTLDVIEQDGEMFIAMEYVHGETLSRLERAAKPPIDVAVRIVCDALQGLHAAHEARNERGEPLHIVHRDVSPQNVLVGVDGIARVVDFGIAKAIDQGHMTRPGDVKGKMRYVAPEQLAQTDVDRRADIYAAGILLWESLTGTSLRPALELPRLVTIISQNRIEPPSRIAPDVPPELDAIVMRALRSNPAERFAHASDMAAALELAFAPATHARVGEWVQEMAAEKIAQRGDTLRQMEVTPVPRDAAEPPRKARGVRRWAWALAPIVVIPIVAIALTVTRSRARNVEPTLAVATSGAASALIGTASASTLASAAPTPSASSSVVAMSSAGPRRGRAPPGPGAHRSVVRDCRIPYTIGSDGVRVPRPECM